MKTGEKKSNVLYHSFAYYYIKLLHSFVSYIFIVKIINKKHSYFLKKKKECCFRSSRIFFFFAFLNTSAIVYDFINDIYLFDISGETYHDSKVSIV